jgi:hypothetical protein
MVTDDQGRGARPGGGDDLGPLPGRRVGAGDADAARGRGVVSGEAAQERSVLAAEDLDLGAAAGVGAGDDVGSAVAVNVAGRHEGAAPEGGVVGEEAAQRPGEAGAGLAVEDPDFRGHAGSGGGDDVGGAVVVEVGLGDADAAQEGGVVGEELELLGAGDGVEDLDQRRRTGPGAGGDYW